ncbi:MAG TPA: DUF3618 domain-containing protein [Acidimicrobiales bacterium]|nr:DUF3618 domain-containing protein [Acidimicrobiales bacterium]
MAQDPSDVREAIAEQRAALADTVQALASKADVKGRVKGKATETVAQVQDKAQDLGERARDKAPDSAVEGFDTAVAAVRRRPAPFAAAGIFAVGILVGRKLFGRKG